MTGTDPASAPTAESSPEVMPQPVDHSAGTPPAPAVPLAAQPPLPAEDAARVAAVLAAPTWGWLTGTIRTAWEQDLSRTSVRIDVDALTETQATAMADFLRWPTHRIGRVTVTLARIDALLRASGLQAGVAQCLVAAGGPLRDAAGTRRASAAACRAASEQMWADTLAHPACRLHPRLLGWLDEERAAGKLPSDPQVRGGVLHDALTVLERLPDAGTGLAQLASRCLGRAHALDKGPVPAAVLRAVAHLTGAGEVPTGAAGRRELWASVGVARDTVASTVLVLGLRLPGAGPLPVTLAVNAAHGVPVRLTLDQVQRHLEPRPAPDGAPDTQTLRGILGVPDHVPDVVWMCENPSVVEAAAERLRPGCAPLVCVEGRASVAAARLLTHLRHAGSELRYHGDFDWPGIAIAAEHIGSGARPWRLGAADYDAALGSHPDLPPLPDAPAAAASPWDPELAAAMRRHRRQVEEEHLIDVLLPDLSGRARR